MKMLKLSRNMHAIVDEDDYNRLKDYRWFYTSGGYAEGRMGGTNLVKLHRVIMDVPPGMEVDHINHNGLDNRKSNLRIVTHQQNMFNRKRAKHNKSGYIGVGWHSGAGRWQARAKLNGKDKHLGYFDDIEDAVRARDEYVKQRYLGFGVLNRCA